MGPVLSRISRCSRSFHFLPGNPDKRYHPRLPPRQALLPIFFWRGADRKEHSPLAVPVPLLPVPAPLEKPADLGIFPKI
jgi:hypothetical protein